MSVFPGVEDQYAIIGQALADNAPPGWVRAWVTADVFDTSTDAIFDYENAEGEENWFTPDSLAIAEIGSALREIRKAMIAAGQNPWRRCIFSLTADGSFRLDIDYHATDTIV